MKCGSRGRLEPVPSHTPKSAGVEDIAAESESGRPTVFQVFGKLDPTGDYGITEDKILEFTHRLQSRDQRPQNLFDALQAKSLLALGCSFPGWLARFFLRAAKGEQFFSQGARGVIVDRTTPVDSEFVMFLERRQTVVYSQGNAVQFVNELHRRWMEKFGEEKGSSPPPMPAVETGSQVQDFKPDSVFISYASEDRRYALQIKQAFDEMGVDVWFDQSALESPLRCLASERQPFIASLTGRGASPDAYAGSFAMRPLDCS
jgi:hypothetical protein